MALQDNNALADSGRLIGSGAVNAVADIATGVEQMTGSDWQFDDSIRQTGEEIYQGVDPLWRRDIEQSGFEEESNNSVAGLVGTGLKGIGSMAPFVAANLLPGGGAIAAAGKMSAVSGAMIGGGTYNDTKQALEALQPQDLVQSPLFQEALAQARQTANTDEEAFVQARANLTEVLTGDAFKEGLTTGAISGAVLGPALSKMFRGGQGLVKGAKHGAMTEGLQEFAESGSQAYSREKALAEATGTEIDTGKAFREGAFGAVVGAGTGGVVGGATGLLMPGQPEAATPPAMESQATPPVTETPADPVQASVQQGLDEINTLKEELKTDWSQYDQPAVNRQTTRERNGSEIDTLIGIARKEGFAEDEVRLQNAKSMFAQAQAYREADDHESAARYAERGNAIVRDIAEPVLAERVNQFPVPYQFEGELVGSEAGLALPDQGAIYDEEPQTVKSEREQRDADHFNALYGQAGQTPYQPEVIEGELDRSNELPDNRSAMLPPGTGQINKGQDNPTTSMPAQPINENVGRNIAERQADMRPGLPQGNKLRTITPEQFSQYQQVYRQAVRTKVKKRTPEQAEAVQVMNDVKAGQVSVSREQVDYSGYERPTMGIQPEHSTGFDLPVREVAKQPDQPQPQPEAPKENKALKRYNREPDTEIDDLLSAIALGGGIRRDYAEGVDPADFSRRAAGIRYVFPKSKGRSLDDMTEYLAQYGYVQSVEDLQDKLDRALRGEAVLTPEGMMRQADIEAEEEANLQAEHSPIVEDQSSEESYLSVAVEQARIHGVPEGEIASILENETNEILIAVDIRNAIDKIQAEGRAGRNDNEGRERTETEADYFAEGEPTTAEAAWGSDEELLTSYSEQDLTAKDERENDSALAADAEYQAFQANSAETFTLNTSQGVAGEQVKPAVTGGSSDMFGDSQSNNDHAKPKPEVTASANTIFTEDAAEKARELLKRKLGQLNSGLDPEMFQAGITLAGYHIEKGTRSFSAYARAMIEDMGEGIKPYLKQFYMGVKYDPRAANLDGMDDASVVDAFDLDTLNNSDKQESTSATETVSEPIDEFLYARLDEITDNRKLKSAVAEFNNVKPSDVTPAMIKDAQEAMELALVRKARDIVAQGMNERATFDALVQLYQSQPNLNMRSSTSMENQAYSTPAPLAYLAGNLAGINANSTVYEPTAGNGMLLISTSTDHVTANELNDLRAKQLKDQGYSVTQNDATEFTPTEQVDAAIMNPPFGTIAAVKYDGYTIKAIDHLITAKALEAMKDDGKATIIIGASKVAGEIKPADRTFFNWLYSTYNVTDQFEVDGDLYKRQGAGWPVRVITVNGRQASKQISPKSGTIERVETWEQVYDRYLESLDASQSEPSSAESVDGVDSRPSSNEPDATGNQATVENPRPSGEGRSGGHTGTTDSGTDTGSVTDGNVRAGSVSSSSTRNDDGKPKPSGQSSGVQEESQTVMGSPQAAEEPDAGQLGGGSASSTGSVSKASGSGFQSPYVTMSSGSNESVLTPTNMATASEQALKTIQAEVGDLDTYVIDKLGYTSKDELYSSFMGLQIDTIAAAIYNAERNKGIIIADQTGVGKGRQAAGIIRYALRQGKVPVFITVKSNLFTDMYNDLRDIGSTDIDPLILNQDGVVKDGDQVLFKNPTRGSHVKTLGGIAAEGVLPEGKNALFLTYSQLSTNNIQRSVIEAIKDRAFFVMDEAHNAAGERERITKKGKSLTTGGFIYNVIDGAPVAYLSATYAKRPDNIPVYYRTDLTDAVDSIDDLVDAVAAGGEPLQTVMAGMLAESGQLFRRERSFEGIEILTDIDTGNTEAHSQFSDAVTAGLRAITEADKAFHGRTVAAIKDTVETIGASAAGAGNRASSSVDHNNFTSIVHNFISQLLLGLKLQRATEKAIKLHQQGIKPVITLENTMGSFLKEYVSESGLSHGDVIDVDYRFVLQRALDRTRRISIKDPMGNAETKDVPLSDLDPITRAVYSDAEALINDLDLSELPLSPIDYIRHELEKEGIRSAEITGREFIIDYSGDQPVLNKRDAKERKDRRGTVDGFNSGDIDALVLNSAGSTGLSIHASEKFTDQKPRHMIVVQANADINTFMQMLGRINRTGQVEVPKYTMMGLNIPAEKRPLAKTAQKMKSLNANTSANTDSDTSVDAPDILNKYGDKIVKNYLAENPDIARDLDMETSDESDEKDANASGLALRFTGRLALLPVDTQIGIYEDIETTYNDLIEYLNKTNQNDLVPSVLDLDARIQDSAVVYEGKAPDTVFGGHTYMHKVNVKYQGKPPSPDEVKEALGKTKDPDALAKSISEEKGRDTRYERELNKAIDAARAKTDGARNTNASNPSEKNQKAYEEAMGRVGELESRLDHYMRLRAQNERMLTVFKVGNHIRLELDNETVTAVVVGLKNGHRFGKGNPYALSKTRVSFMVNNGIRQIDLPFSQLDSSSSVFVEKLRNSGIEGIDDIFDMSAQLSDRRETRHIATGNVIAGSKKLDGGRIVSFTDNQRVTRQGILMPKNYGKRKEFEIIKEGTSFALRDNAVLVRFLRNNREAIMDGRIQSGDHQIKIMPDSKTDGWVIDLPKANKSKSVKSVKFDKALRDAMGTDFYGNSKRMTAKFADRKLPKVIGILNKLVQMQAPKDLRPAWSLAGGKVAPTATNSFDTQDNPSFHRAMPDSLSSTGANKVAGTTLTVDAVKRATTVIAKRLRVRGVKLVVVKSEELLPGSLKTQAAQDGAVGEVNAVYHHGSIYIVADRMQSVADVEEAILHESVHHGGRVLFGKDIASVKAPTMSSEQAIKPSFSRSAPELKSVIKGSAPDKGLTKEQAQAVADKFMAAYKGNIQLKVIVGETQEDIYGSEGSAEKIGIIKGAYHPARGVFTLAARNLSEMGDAIETIRHEVLGHYGLNTFTPVDKRRILDHILAARHTEGSVGKIWSEIDELYSDKSDDVRAEEIFARVVEKEPAKVGTVKALLDRILHSVNSALRRAGFIKAPMKMGELRRTARYIAEGIRSGRRQQQTFPKTDDVLFSRTSPAADNVYENAFKSLGNKDKSVWQLTKNRLKRELKAGGMLPDAVYKEKIVRDAKVNAMEFDIAHYLAGFENAVKKAYGKEYSKLSDEHKIALNNALSSAEPDAAIPAQVRVEIMSMRNSIRALSQEYADILGEQVEAFRAGGNDAAAESKAQLMETIINNLDTYANRSYRAFDNKNWPKEVSREVFDNAAAYLEQRYTESDMEPDEIKTRVAQTIKTILEEGTAYESMEGFIKETKLGAKDLSVLKKRKQIAPEIRALLGEYEDVKINYAKTITKMGRLITNERFLAKVKEIGLSDGFLFTEDNKPLTGSVTRIAAEGSETYAPLNGYYTYSEIDRAFKDVLGKEEMADWYRTIVRINGMVKYGKTVLSPTTAVRNWMSAFFFAMANGHFNMKHAAKSMEGVREYFHQHGNPGKVAYLRKLKELGVVYDTPYAGEMMDLLADSELQNTIFSKGPLKSLAKANEYAQKFYQYGDDFWKIIGYENEKAMLMKYKGLSESKAEIEAAERIRNTYPTYSMTGKFIQGLRRFPLAGTFVSFPAEIIRTSFHMLNYLKQDMKDSPVYAMRKVAGLAIASGSMYALQALTRDLFDIDDDEEEAVRKMGSPWSKNSNLAFSGRDDKGDLNYVDLSFLDPYNFWKRPINAILRDQPVEDALKQSIQETLSPFFGQDIAFGAIMEIFNNKKKSGGRIYNTADTTVNQSLDIADHLRKNLQPGVASNIERTIKAIKGEVSASGKQYTIKDELLALGGLRFSTFDPQTALYYKSFGFKDEKLAASSILSAAAKNPNNVTDDELMTAYSTARKARAKAFADMIVIANSAKASGMSAQKIRLVLIRSGVSKIDAAYIAQGKIPDWKMTGTTFRNTIKKAELLYGPKVVQDMREREMLILRTNVQSNTAGS
ncbi:MAG: strawberry notch C-terminal domain-containing protein [Pontibacterium sp.]